MIPAVGRKWRLGGERSGERSESEERKMTTFVKTATYIVCLEERTRGRILRTLDLAHRTVLASRECGRERITIRKRIGREGRAEDGRIST